MTRTNAIAQAQERALKTGRTWLAVSDNEETWVAIPANATAYDEFEAVIEVNGDGVVS